MNLLLDTHVALWVLTDDPKLTPRARTLIADTANSLTVSVASLWEISIKRAVRRARGAPLPFSADETGRLCEAAGFTLLPITVAHAVAVESLEHLHGDPFDRLIAAQALVEPLRLVTHDRVLARYSDAVILV